MVSWIIIESGHGCFISVAAFVVAAFVVAEAENESHKLLSLWGKQVQVVEPI